MQGGIQKLIIVLVVSTALFVVAFLFYNLGKDSAPCKPIEVETEQQEQDNSTTSVALKPGEIGELPKIEAGDTGQTSQQANKNPDIPSFVPSTTGIVSRTEQDALIVMGDGYSFEDGVQRELRCVFTDETITVDKNKILYYGMDGLSVLTQGMEVLVSGAENIRGKQEFSVQTIKILQ